jgi:hypothetical protein
MLSWHHTPPVRVRSPELANKTLLAAKRGSLKLGSTSDDAIPESVRATFFM